MRSTSSCRTIKRLMEVGGSCSQSLRGSVGRSSSFSLSPLHLETWNAPRGVRICPSDPSKFQCGMKMRCGERDGVADRHSLAIHAWSSFSLVLSRYASGDACDKGARTQIVSQLMHIATSTSQTLIDSRYVIGAPNARLLACAKSKTWPRWNTGRRCRR